MWKYYVYYGEVGLTKTSVHGFIKIKDETEENCDKSMQYYVKGMTSYLKDDFIDYPNADDYESDSEYELAYNEAVRLYEESVVCYSKDITDNIVNGIAFSYTDDINSTAVMKPEDFKNIKWEEI